MKTMWTSGDHSSGDRLLCDDLRRSAAAVGERPAVEEPGGGSISYAELDALSDRVRGLLESLGVGRGDRVGVYLRKSIDSVAAIFGILKAGAAYVPVDPGSPPERNAFIFGDCAVRASFVEAALADSLRGEMARRGAATTLIELDGVGGGRGLELALSSAGAPAGRRTPAAPSDLAYILYTSGSTGSPKGVMLSHRNATSFVDWCSRVFEPGPDDRFSSHAPFHFDLSVLDLYLSIKHGATLVLVDEELGKNPAGLVRLLADRGLTVWYSTPSVLTLLLQFGRLERERDLALRLVLFAGEVFPVKHLRRLKELVPKPRYFNLYGPTETNVCTFFEIPETIPPERTEPYPIGEVCSHLAGRVVDEAGGKVAPGEEGELWISGPSVMRGYWNLGERTDDAFVTEGSVRWYKTGDLVVEEEPGLYGFIGRRDRMVKRRGYRVEPGEIEAVLYRHHEIAEAAAVALADADGVRIKCFYSTRGGDALSLVDLKRFCADNLPGYMIPDLFAHLASLPKTSTDKIDYQRLKEVG